MTPITHQQKARVALMPQVSLPRLLMTSLVTVSEAGGEGGSKPVNAMCEEGNHLYHLQLLQLTFQWQNMNIKYNDLPDQRQTVLNKNLCVTVFGLHQAYIVTKPVPVRASADSTMNAVC
eukprot:647396-Pelagomonas_calceolata.AAC.4